MPASPRRADPPPPLSAERARLAEVAAAYQALADRRQRLTLAAEKNQSDRLDCRIAMEAQEARLARVQREAPRGLALAAIGEGFAGEGPSVEAAERDLAQARATYERMAEIGKALAAWIVDMGRQLSWAEAERRSAVAAVLDTDGALDTLYAEYSACMAWQAALADCFRLIGLTRLPRRLQHWEALRPDLPAIEEPLPVTLWKEALAALERGEASTALPQVGVGDE